MYRTVIILGNFLDKIFLLAHRKYSSLQPHSQPIFSLEEEGENEALEHFVKGYTEKINWFYCYMLGRLTCRSKDKSKIKTYEQKAT